MLNLSVFSNNTKHHTDTVLEFFASTLCDVKFLLYSHKELILAKTTKSLQDVLIATDPSYSNGLYLQ